MAWVGCCLYAVRSILNSKHVMRDQPHFGGKKAGPPSHFFDTHLDHQSTRCLPLGLWLLFMIVLSRTLPFQSQKLLRSSLSTSFGPNLLSLSPFPATTASFASSSTRTTATASLFGPAFYSYPPYRTMPLPSLTDDVESWKSASLLSVNQITPAGLQLLFAVADDMRRLVRDGPGGDDRLRHCIMASVFFEASTRTACSFQAAMLRLGGRHIHVDGQGNSSAGKKGETLADTIRCLEGYADVTVLRHPVQGSVGKVVEAATKPVSLYYGDNHQDDHEKSNIQISHFPPFCRS